MMARSKKLQFRVAYCSSEDPSYPARELNTHSPHTRGWQSEKLCDYPQEVVLQFDGLVRLSALQILSNESKIAQKIELFVGTCPNPLEPSNLHAAEFRRLGYLSLDSNEKSQWRARELKDVNLSKSGKDTRSQFLKLIVHSNHINAVNIHSQVGIMAVNALGEEMHPFTQDTDLEESLGGDSRSRPIAPPSSTAQNVALDVNFDAQTAHVIRSMHDAKQRAVDEENYDEAKLLKAAIDTLQDLGREVSKLELRKRDAVQREDYDEAKALKKEVDVLRVQVEDVRRASEAGEFTGAPAPALVPAPAPALAPVMPRAAPPQTLDSVYSAASLEHFTERSSNSQQSAQSNVRVSVPEMPDPSPRSTRGGPRALPVFPDDRNRGEFSGARGVGTNHTPAPAPAPAPAMGPPSPRESFEELHPARERSLTPQQEQQQRQQIQQPPSPQQPMSPQLPSEQPQQNRPPVANSPGPMLQSRQLPTVLHHQQQQQQQQQQQPPAPAPAPTPAPAPAPAPFSTEAPPDEPEALREPEPLSASGQKDVASNGLADVIDERTLRCLYSKTWALRENGLQNLAEAYVELPAEPAVAFRAVCYLLRNVFTDRIAQVFTAGVQLLRVALDTAKDGAVRRQDVIAGLNQLTPVLLDKTAESNVRIKTGARSTLLMLAKAPVAGPALIGKATLESTQKKTWKFKLGRLSFLAHLVGQCGIEAGQPNASNGGFVLDNVMPFIVDGMKHQNDNVRSAACEAAAACFQHVGNKIDAYTGDLSQLQLEQLSKAVQRMEMYGDTIEQPPAAAAQRDFSAADGNRRRRADKMGGGGGGGDGGGAGLNGNEENIDPFATHARIRNSNEGPPSSGGGRPPTGGSQRGAGGVQNSPGPGADAVPQMGGRGGVQNSPVGGGGNFGGGGGGGEVSGGDSGATDLVGEADAFAHKPKVRNSFDYGPPQPSPARQKREEPVDSAPQRYGDVPDDADPFQPQRQIRNSVAVAPSVREQFEGPDMGADNGGYEDEEEEMEVPPQAQEAFDKGTAAFEADNCEEAQRAFSEAMQCGHPDVASCLTERGRCYSFLGDNDLALRDYDEAIRLDPEDDVLYQNRGTQLWIMGRLEEAERDFQQMVDLNPDCDSEARDALAKVREELSGVSG